MFSNWLRNSDCRKGLMKRKQARRACWQCRQSHVGCGDTRPCQRCREKGLQCDLLPGRNQLSGWEVMKRARMGEPHLLHYTHPTSSLAPHPQISTPLTPSTTTACSISADTDSPHMLSPPASSPPSPSLLLSDDWLESLLASPSSPSPSKINEAEMSLQPPSSPSLSQLALVTPRDHFESDATSTTSSPILLALLQEMKDLRESTDSRFRLLTAELNRLRSLRDLPPIVVMGTPQLQCRHKTWHTFPPLEFPLEPPPSFHPTTTTTTGHSTPTTLPPSAISVWSLPSMQLLQCNESFLDLLEANAVDMSGTFPFSFHSLVAQPFYDHTRKLIQYFESENASKAEFKGVYQTRGSKSLILTNTTCAVGTMRYNCSSSTCSNRVLWMSFTKVAFYDDRYLLDNIAHDPTFVIHSREEFQGVECSSVSICLEAWEKTHSASMLLPIPWQQQQEEDEESHGGATTCSLASSSSPINPNSNNKSSGFRPCCVSVLDGEEPTKELALALSSQLLRQLS